MVWNGEGVEPLGVLWLTGIGVVWPLSVQLVLTLGWTEALTGGAPLGRPEATTELATLLATPAAPDVGAGAYGLLWEVAPLRPKGGVLWDSVQGVEALR